MLQPSSMVSSSGEGGGPRGHPTRRRPVHGLRAFKKLPPGTVDMLVKPENKTMLTSILTYHVVAGKWDSQALSTDSS